MIIPSQASDYKGKAGSLWEKAKLTQRETRDKDDAFPTLGSTVPQAQGHLYHFHSLLFNYLFDYIKYPHKPSNKRPPGLS